MEKIRHHFTVNFTCRQPGRRETLVRNYCRELWIHASSIIYRDIVWGDNPLKGTIEMECDPNDVENIAKFISNSSGRRFHRDIRHGTVSNLSITKYGKFHDEICEYENRPTEYEDHFDLIEFVVPRRSENKKLIDALTNQFLVGVFSVTLSLLNDDDLVDEWKNDPTYKTMSWEDYERTAHDHLWIQAEYYFNKMKAIAPSVNHRRTSSSPAQHTIHTDVAFNYGDMKKLAKFFYEFPVKGGFCTIVNGTKPYDENEPPYMRLHKGTGSEGKLNPKSQPVITEVQDIIIRIVLEKPENGGDTANMDLEKELRRLYGK